MDKQKTPIQVFQDIYGDVEKIGKLNYLLSIIFGKNKAVKIFNIEKENESETDKNKQYFYQNEIIVTISKDFLIITKLIEKKQIPIVVKKWKQLPKTKKLFANLIPDGTEYKDSAENRWLHLKTSKLESLNLETKSGEKITFILK